MSLSKFRAETVKTLAFGSVVAGYTKVGTSYANPISKILVSNLTDESLMFSFDGSHDHFALPANGFIMLDITMDQGTPDYLPVGDALYVKRIGTPTLGSVYATAFYGTNR